MLWEHIEDSINYDAGNEVSVLKDEMQEVMNYRNALFYALDKMSTISDDSEEGKYKLPLSVRLIIDYMSNLENYIHYDEIDLLVQAALIHCQFEMIHPFKDGNGRIGRLLIPLFLYYRDMLPVATFYMSAFFEKDRNLYLEKLSAVSKNNDYSIRRNL